MVTSKIKRKLRELDIHQKVIAEELTLLTNKKYNQSMISKILKDDQKLTVDEFILIYLLINRIGAEYEMDFVYIDYSYYLK